jgi:hypothetical protein
VAFLVLVLGSGASIFSKYNVSSHPETFPADEGDYFIAYGTCFIFENNR